MKSAEKLLLLFVCAMASVAAAAAPSRDASRLLEARRIAICPASSTGFCARERRRSVPNPTTFTPPLGSDPRSPSPSKADPGLAMPRKHGVELERGSPEIVERILELLESGPLRSSAIRKAVGICSGIHLSRYYLTPMMEKGLIKRTDPDHPQSPQQRYRLA